MDNGGKPGNGNRARIRAILAMGVPRHQRLHHALWASLLALLFSLTNTLEPFDRAGWTLQSRMSQRPASGQIVFIQAESNTTDPDVPAKRFQLAELLEVLKASGAADVYVDLIFDQPSQTAADNALLKASLNWGDRLRFVDRVDVSLTNPGREFRSIENVAGGTARVWFGVTSEWPNTIFAIPRSYHVSEGIRPSFAAAMASAPPTGAPFQIDYGFARKTIPATSAKDIRLTSPSRLRATLAGKIVVISTSRGATNFDFRVPHQFSAPPSYVAIYAAETLQKGGVVFISGGIATGLTVLLLCFSSIIASLRARYIAYCGLALLAGLTLLASNSFDIRVESACGISSLIIFSGLRLRIRWQDRGANVDPDTGLPTIRALKRDLYRKSPLRGFIIVAKIHNFENILKLLELGQRAAYICKLRDRLRVGNPKLDIYLDGHYLAWREDEIDADKIVEHLEGLRAIFAAPVTVGEQTIDVGITFGAAELLQINREKAIESALAAAEETDEALQPVRIADDFGKENTLWDLSLRARIDAAMETGEVFCLYQPKVHVASGTIIGVEALVRWRDPERGFISPTHFVMQCEKAGRMEYLTRYVLQSACSAARLLHFRGKRLTMAVNISATLLNDMRIVGIVRNVLQATSFDPQCLVLEITETARILDLEQARRVLLALKGLGAKLSMDDFGSGSANFETLQALPFDEIKIDRQFVSRAAQDPKAKAITASLIKLGYAAQLEVVAEGAENDADLRTLREIGCQQVQGYALFRPVTLGKLLTLSEALDPKGANCAF